MNCKKYPKQFSFFSEIVQYYKKYLTQNMLQIKLKKIYIFLLHEKYFNKSFIHEI